MRKYIVLFFLLIASVGCLVTSPAIRVNNAVRQRAQRYAIAEEVRIAVFGNPAQDIADVFYDFGFIVIRDKDKADYVAEVEMQQLGWGKFWGYYIYPVKLRMRIIQKNGEEYYYKADGVFKHFVSHSGGTYQYPNDPYGLAAKIAAVEAIGDFIEEQGISHRWPKAEK